MTKPEVDNVKMEYEVGYGKPPKATQFKAGQSGNRKGRPKGSLNITASLEKELKSPVVITEGGRRKTVRKMDVIAKQLANKAASGDLKAASLVMAETRSQEAATGFSSTATGPQELSQIDQLTVNTIIDRIRASAPAEDKTGNGESNPPGPELLMPESSETSNPAEEQQGGLL